jgi:hypothetical protein
MNQINIFSEMKNRGGGWKHLQFCDGRVSLAEGDGSGFESFRMRLFWNVTRNFRGQKEAVLSHGLGGLGS